MKLIIQGGNSLTADLYGIINEKHYILLGIIFHSFKIEYLAFLFTKTYCSNNHLEFGKFIGFKLLSHQDKTYHMLEEVMIQVWFSQRELCLRAPVAGGWRSPCWAPHFHAHPQIPAPKDKTSMYRTKYSYRPRAKPLAAITKWGKLQPFQPNEGSYHPHSQMRRATTLTNKWGKVTPSQPN